MTRSTIRGMSPKPSVPSRKPATATSFAAFIAAGPRVDRLDVLDRARLEAVVSVHDALDDTRDVAEAECAVEEAGDRHLVRGVHCRGHRTAFAPGSERERETRERLDVRLLEGEGAECR